MLGSLGAIVAGLGLILALFGLVTRALGRSALSSKGGNGRLPLEVLQRVAVGQRQGLALVRVGERVVVVSVGDGGVRTLMECTESEARTAIGAATEEAPRMPGAVRFQNVLGTAFRRASVLALLALPLLFCTPGEALATGTGLTAVQQQLGVEGDPEQVSMLPRIDLQLGGAADGDGLRLTGTVGAVVLLGFLTLLPSLVLLMTGFTRILVVLHILRQALGTQGAPPGHLVAALALVLTGFVMTPTLHEVHEVALEPWLAGEIDEAQMLEQAAGPFRQFMLDTTREQDVVTFMDLSSASPVASVDEIPLATVLSAFVASELRTAFQIGFMLILPFLVIDLVVASTLMSMGMFMLPPAMVALPCKVLLFVLVDGWSLLAQSLIQSFH